MSNYPDNFTGTNMDCDRCRKCGRREYNNDDGVCDECEEHEQRALKHKALELEIIEQTANAAYARIVMDLGNISLAKKWGWI